MQTCECGVSCKNKFSLKRHRATKSHELNLKCDEALTADEHGNYQCSTCNFTTLYKGNYRDHLLSQRHKTNVTSHNENVVEAVSVSSELKTSQLIEVFSVFMKEHNESLMNMMTNVMNQNTDIIKTLSSKLTNEKNHTDQSNILMSNSTIDDSHDTTTTTTNSNNTTNTTTTTNHNKKFNLNFFLNEECKNAMNLSDFIQSIVVEMEDLSDITQIGYVQAMTKIITKAMKERHKTERPMHCSDVKRETIYIRKANAWEQDVNKEETHRFLSHLIKKCCMCMKAWYDEHPDCQIQDSPDNEMYYSILQEITRSSFKYEKKLTHRLAELTEINQSGDGDF